MYFIILAGNLLIPIHYQGTLKYRVKVEEIQYGEQTSGTNPGNG